MVVTVFGNNDWLRRFAELRGLRSIPQQQLDASAKGSRRWRPNGMTRKEIDRDGCIWAEPLGLGLPNRNSASARADGRFELLK